MFKKISTLCVLLGIGLFCEAQGEFPNPESYDNEQKRLTYKKNAVKTIEVFKSIEGLQSDSSNLLETISLDPNGYLVYSKKVDPNGRNVIVNQKFDSVGNLLSFKQFIGDRFFNESTFYYDSENNLLSKVTINFSGKRDSVDQKKRIEYSKGKKITSNSEGAFVSKTIEEYDDKKGLLKSTTFDKNGLPIQIWEYELNERGQILSKSILKSIGSNDVSKLIHTYNEADLRTETKHFDQKQELVEKITFEYNEQGLLIRETTQDLKNEKTIILTYRYQ
jgi:YD repeat-containing protein